MKNASAAFAVLLSVLVASFLGRALIRASSPTYDEPVHLAAGYTDLVTGRYRLNAMDHPPLGEMWAALPLLARRLDRFSSHPAWEEGQVYHFGDLFLYRNRVSSEVLLGAARTWSLVTLTLLVAAALVLWARRLGGAPAAWGAAAALAFCVPWISNAALVTTDAPSAALFFAACSLFAAPRRTAATWALAGAAAGGALAAKFNMILLPPLAGFALIAESRADKARRPSASDTSSSPWPPPPLFLPRLTASLSSVYTSTVFRRRFLGCRQRPRRHIFTVLGRPTAGGGTSPPRYY